MRRPGRNGRPGSPGIISAPRPLPPVSPSARSISTDRLAAKAPRRRGQLLGGLVSVAATPIVTRRESKTEIIYLETGPD
jgi:hypothetical protein